MMEPQLRGRNMTTTPNLLGEHITETQEQKATTANELFDLLDEGIGGLLIHDFASDADYTLDTSEPDKEHENYVLKFTDTGVVLTTTRNVILPAQRQAHLVWNATAQSLVVKISGSSDTVTVAAGGRALVYADAVDVWEYSNTVQPYIEAFYFGATPTASQELIRLEACIAHTFPVNLAGSTGNAKVAATAQTIFSIQKNGTPFATATFAISATTCTFVAASSTSFVADTDVITVVAPATPDATLSGIGFMFKGIR